MSNVSFPKISYGPLLALFKAEDVTEIMVNDWDRIFVEHQGRLINTKLKFDDQKAFHFLIGCILDLQPESAIHQRYTFDGLLPEGYRFNITIPPVTPYGPTLTIRKFATKIFTLDDLIDKGSLSGKAAVFLKEAMENRLTMMISGGTGTGKTAFINTLSTFISDAERVVSIEDTQELRPLHPNWIHMITSKNDNTKYSARDCLTNSLRMRPDRIIVGECRGPEAYDFLQAINTGHEGSVTSVHANSAVDALSRLENLVTLGHSEIPLKFIRHQISNGIDLIIQLQRLPSGKRQVSEILELVGMEGDVITRGTIFSVGKSGFLDAVGYVPDCLKKFKNPNSNITSNFFDPDEKLPQIA